MVLYLQQPSLDRKKLVSEKYNPDSFRVISLEAEQRYPYFRERTVYQNTFLDPPRHKLPPIHQRKSEPIIPSTLSQLRQTEVPTPAPCLFLRENVATVNEPVGVAPGWDDGGPWWRHDVVQQSYELPYTLDSTSRRDYQQKYITPSSRFGCNPNKQPALGSVPINSLQSRHGYPRVWKEKTSYEHIYNSRTDPNYTLRGRRHGAFVWNEVPHEQAKPFLDEIFAKKATKTVEKRIKPAPPTSRSEAGVGERDQSDPVIQTKETTSPVQDSPTSADGAAPHTIC